LTRSAGVCEIAFVQHVRAFRRPVRQLRAQTTTVLTKEIGRRRTAAQKVKTPVTHADIAQLAALSFQEEMLEKIRQEARRHRWRTAEQPATNSANIKAVSPLVLL
jgi:hypothetical protein